MSGPADPLQHDRHLHREPERAARRDPRRAAAARRRQKARSWWSTTAPPTTLRASWRSSSPPDRRDRPRGARGPPRALRGAQPRGARSARRPAALSRRRRCAGTGVARGLPHGISRPTRRRRRAGRSNRSSTVPLPDWLDERFLPYLSAWDRGREVSIASTTTSCPAAPTWASDASCFAATATSSSSSGAGRRAAHRARRSSSACGSSAAARRSSICRRALRPPSRRDRRLDLGRLDGGALRRAGLLRGDRRLAARRPAGASHRFLERPEPRNPDPPQSLGFPGGGSPRGLSAHEPFTAIAAARSTPSVVPLASPLRREPASNRSRPRRPDRQRATSRAQRFPQ